MIRAAWGKAGTLAVALWAIGVLLPASALAQAPVITTQPALQPAFNPAITNYVTSCEPGGDDLVTSDPNGNVVSIDGGRARSVNTLTTVTPLSSGQAFTIVVGTGASATTYTVRCLPPDFPQYTAQIFGPRQAAYYLMTPDSSATAGNPGSTYVALFDANGTPVWWYRVDGFAMDADLDPGGDLSWDVESGGEEYFGTPGEDQVQQRDLNGNLLGTFQTVGTPTDFHEAWPLGDGDFLIDSYQLQTHAPIDLAVNPLAVPNVVNAAFQDVEPNGKLAYAWSSGGHISQSESDTHFPVYEPYPGMIGDVVDDQHINAIQPYENGYLISLRNTDAIYYIDAATGDVVWKLGGTSTPQSLTIVGAASTVLQSQHDVRAWPDGTVSVMDNSTFQNQGPRVLRFSIDAAAGTATLIQTLTDPLATSSLCCGSARLLPGGNWVVAWGATPYVDEMTSTGTVVMRFTFPSVFTYRAVPILPGQLSPSALVDGMNTMYPRTKESDIRQVTSASAHHKKLKKKKPHHAKKKHKHKHKGTRHGG